MRLHVDGTQGRLVGTEGARLRGYDVRLYCGRRSKTVGAGRSSFPIGFGRIIMSTASDPQLPQRPWRSRSVGTRQSTHHQCRSTHACPRSTFVFDMAPLWAKAPGRSIGAKSLFWRQNCGTKVLKPARHPPPYSGRRPIGAKRGQSEPAIRTTLRCILKRLKQCFRVERPFRCVLMLEVHKNVPSVSEVLCSFCDGFASFG